MHRRTAAAWSQGQCACALEPVVSALTHRVLLPLVGPAGETLCAQWEMENGARGLGWTVVWGRGCSGGSGQRGGCVDGLGEVWQ